MSTINHFLDEFQQYFSTLLEFLCWVPWGALPVEHNTVWVHFRYKANHFPYYLVLGLFVKGLTNSRYSCTITGIDQDLSALLGFLLNLLEQVIIAGLWGKGHDHCHHLFFLIHRPEQSHCRRTQVLLERGILLVAVGGIVGLGFFGAYELVLDIFEKHVA